MEQQVKSRLARLLEQPFRVHSEDLFDKLDAEAVIMSSIPAYQEFLEAKKKLQSEQHLIAHELRVFYGEPLLTREQEYHWFRQFNFLKYKAMCVLKAVDPTELDIEKGEKLLAQAMIIKRQLAESNVRLVMNLAKKQKEYKGYGDFDLLTIIVSDGYIGLMRAVDYFDYRLGNKFSTYATWAILDIMKRSRKNRCKHSTACVNVLDDSLYEVPDVDDEIPDHIPIECLLGKIPSRQCKVLIDYYGLKGKPALTLQEIGDNLGLSKERVRQLREAGLSKMRALLVEY